MFRWFRRDKKKKKEAEEQSPAPQIIEPPEQSLAVPDLDDYDDSDLDFIYEDEYGRILVPDDDEAFLSEAEESWEEPAAALLKTEETFFVPRPPEPAQAKEPAPAKEPGIEKKAEEPPVVKVATEPAVSKPAPPEPVVPPVIPSKPPRPKKVKKQKAEPQKVEPPKAEPITAAPKEITIKEPVIKPVPPAQKPVITPPVEEPAFEEELPGEEFPEEEFAAEDFLPDDFLPEDILTEEALAEEALAAEPVEEEPVEEEPEKKKKGLFARFKERLANTRAVLTTRVDHLLLGVKEIDEDVLEELEEILILADMGVKTTTQILQTISTQVARKELSSADKLKESLRNEMRRMLQVPPPEFNHHQGPHVIMVVGVNGVGKTTTIAKLSHRFVKEGKKVMMVAGDTFRAAAVEQLTIWSEKVGADIVKQSTGADPSAVVFDALQAAQARDVDVVIIDTAGRLHTKVNLMEELKKIRRVADKSMPGAPHEVLLVLDANTGQNAVNQAKLFNEAVTVDHLAMTKLDGTAKGGVVVAIYNELKLPIRYVGLGEKMEDLRDFDPDAFVEALFG